MSVFVRPDSPLARYVPASPVLLLSLIAGLALLPGQTPSDPEFDRVARPFLAKNCAACHNASLSSGGLNVQTYTTSKSVAQDRDQWEQMLHKAETGEMPPTGAPRPNPQDLKAFTTWVQHQFTQADAAQKPNPGRVTARRLNRAEYNNTIRDLLGVDFHPADDFPADDSGYGFDNVADALSLSPVLMEKYLSAAERIAQIAIFGPEILKPTVVRHQPPYRAGSDGGDNSRFLSLIPFTITDYDVTGLSLPSALHTMHNFPADGVYEFRVDPEGNRPRPSDPFPVAIWIDGKQLATIPFEASDNPTAMEGLDKEIRVKVPAGNHWVAVSALRQYEGLPTKYGGLNPTQKPEPPPQAQPDPNRFKPPADATPEQKAEFEQQRKLFLQRRNRGPRITDVSFHVNFIEISGPFDQTKGPNPETLKKIFTCNAATTPCARQILTALARRAYRRPATPAEVDSLVNLVTEDRKRGASFQQAIGVALEAILVSPNFLFRIERDPKPTSGIDPDHRVTDYELASRLSYFLWSSMPDDELLRCAAQQKLRQPAVLEAQVKRMLKDPRSQALVENFGGQWLQFRALESVRPDPEKFMAFDDYLRLSMRRETELFFENLIHTDGSVLDFIDAKYSFLNGRLAEYYGIPGVRGPEFRKVDLAGSHRAGVLTQGSVLTVSSYATRTSVVLRGKWVLENLLNAPVPPPPANVPALDEAAVGTSMTLRQQMEKHRANTVCASCHSRMDPIGFSLENYDAIGRWRTQDGKFTIDSSGTLPDGRTFHGPEELSVFLKSAAGPFSEGIGEKMLIYALGRGLERFDKPTVRSIANHLAANQYKFSSLVLGIVNSLPFQQRKGDRGIS